MKTVKLNAFDNPCVYGVDNKEYLVFNIDNETQTLKFQSLIGDLKVKTANILFKANSLPAKLYEMVVDDDILTFTLPSVLTGYNGSMYVYLLLNYSDDLSTSDLYTFKLVDKGSSTFNFEISSICESNISTIVSEEIKNERVAKSILDTVSNYEFDKLQHAQQSLSLVENAFSSTLEKRIDLFNSAYDKANATKSNTTGDINDSDIDIPSSNTDSDLKDYVENVKTQMSERLKDVTVVSQQIQDEMTQEKQSFLGSSLIFQQDLKQERDIISAYGESTRQHMDQEFNEVKDHADKVFADFSKEIPDLDASIKQVNDKIVATDNKVGTLNTKVTNVENDITELEKMHNEVTQTINNGKLISLYSNSLDFGDYDYSGNPNLMRVIKASDFRRDGDSDVLISDVEYNSIRLTSQGVNRLCAYTETNIPSLVTGKTYTISAKVKIEEGTTGDIDQLRVAYRKTKDGTVLLTAISDGAVVGKEIIIKGTATVNYKITELERFYLEVKAVSTTGIVNGSVIVSDVKIEEGSEATPYQPNLLDAPYYLSKVPLGENIADSKKVFPIKTSAYNIYLGKNTEKYQLNQTYTITMKATKPATQQFGVFLLGGATGVGNMKPVEGLTDVWELTFKVTQAHIDAGITDVLSLYQLPQSTVGACQIDWLKIEKGDTRTPNIESYKYKGVSLRNTVDPRAFDWQEQTVADVSTLKEQVNTLTPKVDNSQLFKLTKDDGNTIKVDYMSPKPTSFLALAKNTGFYSISTAEAKLMSDYNELPTLLQDTFLFINNYPPRDGFIIQEITGGGISTQLVHRYYRRIEPDNTYKNWNKVITDKDASKMKTLYSNSTDFGDYDYSGRPNLFLNLDFSKLSNTGSAITEPPAYVKDGGSYFVLDFSHPSANDVDRGVYIPAVGQLEKGATYIVTVPMMISDDFSTDYRASPIYPYCVSANNVATRVTSLYPDNSCRGKWGFIKKTFTVPTNVSDGEFTYFHVYSTRAQVGKLYIGYDIKIEKVTSTSDTATPYQPNLLDEPYYLSKVPLGKNLITNAQFPITTLQGPNGAIYFFDTSEEIIIGETYTVSLKGTPTLNKEFHIYLGGSPNWQATLRPVEGLKDVWSATFKAVNSTGTSKLSSIALYQKPDSVPDGSFQIDWFKIEKGDTRTPNVSQFKYFGEGLKDSNNPNDYSWDITPEYAEKSLNDTISLTDSKVAELGSVKADKTALSQTNILLTNGLNSKVDKGGNEQISMGMLTTEVKTAMTGGSVAVVGNGSVNTSAMVDNAATTAKRTRLGEMGLVTIFDGARMDFDFVNRKITIPAIANIINRKDKYEKNTMTELPFLPGIKSQSLVYDVSIKDFRLIGSSDISSFNENMLLLAHINTAAGYVSSPSDYTVNGTKAEDRYYNYVAYYGGLISSKKIGSSVKLFFSTPLEKLYIKTRNSSKIIIVENQELEIPHNHSLVADFNENILKIVNSDRINYAFQMPLVTAHNGLIKYSALLISNATTHTYDSVVAYPAGEILSNPVGSGVRLTFTGIDRNSSFYVKTRTGNHIINLKSLSIFDQSSNSITVPHNSSLVFNDILKTFEIIDSDFIERDEHIVFIAVHNGLIKWNVGLRLVDQNQSVPQIEYRRPINKRDLYVSQGGCVVGNQLWLFEDAGATHAVEKRIWRLNANDLSDIDTIPHTMAHCNGVDFIDGYLLVFNGAATPPEINITKNVTEETASLYFSSPENTQIVFKEGTKQLEGDGSACFGEAFNIVYYAGYNGIYKILLGTGANDLSDKTDDKSDMSSWGTFISGRSIDEYNGTARILRTYTGPSLGQPQDMIFDGKLYIQRDYSTLNYSALTFNDDTNSYSISERVEIDVRDENYNKMHIEPEAITFYKNKIIMGGRGQKNILASIYRK